MMAEGSAMDLDLSIFDDEDVRVFTPLQDLRQDVVAVLGEEGEVVEQYRYDVHGLRWAEYGDGSACDPFEGPGSRGEEPGQRQPATMSTCLSRVGNPMGWQGSRISQVTGVYDMRARHYDPRLRVFLSRDPLGYIDSFDVWLYAGGDPLGMWDPWGESSGCTGGCAPPGDGSFLVEPRIQPAGVGAYRVAVEQDALVISMSFEVAPFDGVTLDEWAEAVSGVIDGALNNRYQVVDQEGVVRDLVFDVSFHERGSGRSRPSSIQVMTEDGARNLAGRGGRNRVRVSEYGVVRWNHRVWPASPMDEPDQISPFEIVSMLPLSMRWPVAQRAAVPWWQNWASIILHELLHHLGYDDEYDVRARDPARRQNEPIRHDGGCLAENPEPAPGCMRPRYIRRILEDTNDSYWNPGYHFTLIEPDDSPMLDGKTGT